MSYATAQSFTTLAKNVTSVATPKRADLVESVVHDFIARKFKPLRHAAKLLADAACVNSVSTARAWLDGRSIPHGDNLLNLCISCEELQMELHQLCIQMRAARSK